MHRAAVCCSRGRSGRKGLRVASAGKVVVRAATGVATRVEIPVETRADRRGAEPRGDRFESAPRKHRGADRAEDRGAGHKGGGADRGEIAVQVARTVATVVRAMRAPVQSVVIWSVGHSGPSAERGDRGRRSCGARAPSVVIEARAIRVRAPSVAIMAQAIRALVRTAVTAEQPTRASLQIMATGVQVRQSMLEPTRRVRAMRDRGDRRPDQRAASRCGSRSESEEDCLSEAASAHAGRH